MSQRSPPEVRESPEAGVQECPQGGVSQCSQATVQERAKAGVPERSQARVQRGLRGHLLVQGLPIEWNEQSSRKIIKITISMCLKITI